MYHLSSEGRKKLNFLLITKNGINWKIFIEHLVISIMCCELVTGGAESVQTDPL